LEPEERLELVVEQEVVVSTLLLILLFQTAVAKAAADKLERVLLVVQAVETIEMVLDMRLIKATPAARLALDLPVVYS
jgi:hypothetical protein